MILTAAIFAGGASRRMGADKAALTLGGETLLARTVRVARAAGLPALVVGRSRPDDWADDWDEPGGGGATFAPDDAPGLGPLGALATALRRSPGPVLALACDLPRLSPPSLRWLADGWRAAQSAGPRGLAVESGGRLEPLFSVYAPACLARAESRLAERRLSLHGLIEAGGFARIEAPDWVADALVNVNTPEEWARQKKGPGG